MHAKRTAVLAPCGEDGWNCQSVKPSIRLSNGLTHPLPNFGFASLSVLTLTASHACSVMPFSSCTLCMQMCRLNLRPSHSHGKRASSRCMSARKPGMLKNRICALRTSKQPRKEGREGGKPGRSTFSPIPRPKVGGMRSSSHSVRRLTQYPDSYTHLQMQTEGPSFLYLPSLKAQKWTYFSTNQRGRSSRQ